MTFLNGRHDGARGDGRATSLSTTTTTEGVVRSVVLGNEDLNNEGSNIETKHKPKEETQGLQLLATSHGTLGVVVAVEIFLIVASMDTNGDGDTATTGECKDPVDKVVKGNQPRITQDGGKEATDGSKEEGENGKGANGDGKVNLTGRATGGLLIDKGRSQSQDNGINGQLESPENPGENTVLSDSNHI